MRPSQQKFLETSMIHIISLEERVSNCVSKPPIRLPRTMQKQNRKVLRLQSVKAHLHSLPEVPLSSSSRQRLFVRVSSVLQVSLALVYVRILCRIGPITSSSLSSFQNPSHCPSSWDLVGMPGAIDPCPQYWFISRAFRNKITHILNGNHGPKKPWYQQHSQACDAFISIGTLKIAGSC